MPIAEPPAFVVDEAQFTRANRQDRIAYGRITGHAALEHAGGRRRMLDLADQIEICGRLATRLLRAYRRLDRHIGDHSDEQRFGCQNAEEFADRRTNGVEVFDGWDQKAKPRPRAATETTWPRG
jgi:hypothetical protein